ncbi:hypothetical protein SELMODRAFT_86017, partial [Selaginella moellendorffii]
LIFFYLYSDDECDHLIGLALPRLRRSSVIDEKTGLGKDSRNRTSWGAFLRRDHDNIVSGIEDRISSITFIPKEYGESLQVVRYKTGQKFEPHQDYYKLTENNNNGGHRIGTLLLYLTNVENGGETVFPRALANVINDYSTNTSECTKKGIVIRPRRGDGLLFWITRPSGEIDPFSFHGGCPVVKGEKWLATKFLHEHELKL